MSWHKDLACSLPRGWSSQPRSSWCSPSADVAPPVTEGLEPGKRRGAPSRIFKGLNPELWCCFSCYLALQAVMFQGHLRFLWLIFPDAWTFFFTPNKFPEINNDFGFSPLRGMSQWVFSNYLQGCFFLTFAIFYHTRREILHSSNRTHAQRGYPNPPFFLH